MSQKIPLVLYLVVFAWCLHGERCVNANGFFFFFYFKRLEITYFHMVVITLVSADDKYQVWWPGYMKATALLVDVVVPLERKLLIFFFPFFFKILFLCSPVSFCAFLMRISMPQFLICLMDRVTISLTPQGFCCEVLLRNLGWNVTFDKAAWELP